MLSTLLDRIASLFKANPAPVENARPVKNKKKTVLDRCEDDFLRGDIQKAISRLEGAMAVDPLDKDFTNKLSELYIQNNDLLKAGKLLYLKQYKGVKEIQAVEAFQNSLGNDPALILKKMINREFFELSLLDDYQVTQLETLLEAVKLKEGKVPKFLLALDSHIVKRRKHKAC